MIVITAQKANLSDVTEITWHQILNHMTIFYPAAVDLRVWHLTQYCNCFFFLNGAVDIIQLWYHEDMHRMFCLPYHIRFDDLVEEP